MRGSVKKIFVAIEKAEEVFGDAWAGATIESFRYCDGGNDKDLVIELKSNKPPKESVDLMSTFTEWLIDNDIKNVVFSVRSQ